MLKKCNYTFKYDKTTSRWRQVSVLMSESFIHSFNWFIQTADSFRNEASDCPYEWATESFDSLDSFKKSETHNSSAVALIGTIFIKSLNFNFVY